MYILGLNSVYHESAACLIEDGAVVAMAEEERFNRIKHGKKPLLDNPDELPGHAIHYCLETAGIDISQVDHIGYSSDPRLRRQNTFENSDLFANNIERVPCLLEAMGFRGRFHWIEHHAAHAASAFFASPFEEAAVLSIDGIGDASTTASFHGAGNQLRFLQDVASPHSLGFLWELVSMFLGFDIYDATKIMGLATYGNPERFAGQFEQVIQVAPEGKFTTNQDLLRFIRLDYVTPSGYFGGLEKLFGLKRRERGQPLTPDHEDIAAALQKVTDEVLLWMTKHLYERTASANLCLAGGVALNCVTNQRIFEEGPFDELFVQPATHDAGTALGAALYIFHHVLGGGPRRTMHDAYLGPSFSPAQIQSALDQSGLRYTRSDSIEKDVARLLSEGQVVGYLQGRMEIGPRALGNRSLLADPRNPNMREILNQKVKHREHFRPFAPSVLHEAADEWFVIEKPTTASDYMLMAYPTREHLKDKIPAVVHVDGSSRIQTVRKDANPRYHRLISEFRELTGVPVILNTSFNDSEPIVCSPDDAIQTFLKTEIDYLALGDFLVGKADNRDVQARFMSQRTRLASPWPPPIDRSQPLLYRQLVDAVSRKRVSRVGGIHVLTDRLDYLRTDQVLPVYPEQCFFLDELDQEAIRGADVLEIGAGSGLLSIAAALGEARRVVALEISPRARAHAGFNCLLNAVEDRVEMRDGSDDLFAPVGDEKFGYIISNPPFMPTPPGAEFYLHSAAGILGLDFTEKLLAGLDEQLVEDGRAQIVMIAAGNRREPTVLADMIGKYLSGSTVVRINPGPQLFRDWVGWLELSGIASPQQARTMLRMVSQERGVTHLHLCMLHYRKGRPGGVSMEYLDQPYENWHLPIAGIEQRCLDARTVVRGLE